MYKFSYKPFIMKGLAILFTLAFCTLTIWAQNVTIPMKHTTVKKAIEYLQRSYDYSFVINTSEIDINRTITLNAEKGAPLDDVLAQIFREQDIEYAINGKRISISKKKKQPVKIVNFKIDGKIVDETGAPLTGAAIIEQGTMNGATADYDGRFSFKTESASPTIIISYVGYEDQIIKVSHNMSDISLQMKPSALMMDEVVVVGYGTMTRRDVTSAITTFKPVESDQRAALSVDQMLQGHIPGVNISTTSGAPGSVSRVSIRGIGSLNAGNEPLYVVDGVPLNSTSGDTGAWTGSSGGGDSSSGLVNINPADIESVEILKDAASAAIYGSRATNGVIIITTKKGKKGKAQISLDGQVALAYLPRTDKLEMADSDLLIQVFNEAVDNYNAQTGKSIARYTDLMPGKKHHKWLDDVLRVALSYSGSASISGGSDKMTYYVSGNFKHNEGVIIKNDMNQYNLKFNLAGDIKKWLNVGINSQLNYTDNKRIPTGYTGFNPIKLALEQYPWHDTVLPNGEWSTSDGILANHNPVELLNEQHVSLDTYRAISSLFFNFNICKGLTFKTNFGEDFSYVEERIHYTDKHTYAKPSDTSSGGQLIDSRKIHLSLIWENTLSYNTNFNFGLKLDAVLGHSVQIDRFSTASQTGRGFPTSDFDVNSVASIHQDVGTGMSAYALQSYFGRLNLNYKDRYVMTLTLRTDGSSKFAKGNRYGIFPSASIGWNLNKEEWWPSAATAAKIRGSWGATGNQGGIGAYSYRALAEGGLNYNNQSGIGLKSQGNKDLQWEKAIQYNIGLDFSFFNGALSLVADIFQKDTQNLLYSKPTRVTSGFTNYLCNIGSMSNRGLELGISSNLGKGDFHWKGNFNISFVKNRLTELLDDNEVISTSGMHGLKVGEEVGSFYMIKFLGIYQSDEQVPEYLYKNEGVRAGDCIYDDYNKDGKIDVNDKQFVGSANPLFSGGFNNSFSYRGFDLGIFLTYSYGNRVYEYWTGGLRLGNGIWPQLKSACEQRWTGPGTTNKSPRAIYGYSWNSTKFVNTRFLHDASYLRCRSLTFGYSLPKRLLERIRMDNLRIFFQADNLFVITPWPYLDPEVSVSTSATTMGWDWLSPTQPRTFTFGLNVKF